MNLAPIPARLPTRPDDNPFPDSLDEQRERALHGDRGERGYRFEARCRVNRPEMRPQRWERSVGMGFS
jgi:hypothetical protein